MIIRSVQYIRLHFSSIKYLTRKVFIKFESHIKVAEVVEIHNFIVLQPKHADGINKIN